MKNFHLAIAVTMAIQSPFIRRCGEVFIPTQRLTWRINRLQDTWAFLDQLSVTRFQKLSDLFSPSKNFSEYRKVMKDLEAPAVGWSTEPFSFFPFFSFAIEMIFSTFKHIMEYFYAI